MDWAGMRVGDPLMDSRLAELMAWSEDLEDEAIRQEYPVAQTEQDLTYLALVDDGDPSY